jgi:hypothetical protein
MLALNEGLLNDFYKIFIAKKQISFNDRVEKFIKYIQLPVIISTHQNNVFNDPRIQKQQGNLFKITNVKNCNELVRLTKLKLMLIDSDDYINPTFTTVNIINDKIDVRYSATYKTGESRERAIKHINALLQDVGCIKIYDKYMAAASNWNSYTVPILKEILPQKTLTIEIHCPKNNWNKKKQELLMSYCSNWNIIHINSNYSNIHDRYIEADNVEILLTSGFQHFYQTNKDFSYLVRIM